VKSFIDAFLREMMYGIEELYVPSHCEASVDIVAVHGLDGDATGTWTSQTNNVCWLRDEAMLPKYIPEARVLTWGYNASYSNLKGDKPSKDRIHHHARNLVQELYSDRMLEHRLDKPIIFLCHSLGGIVVKRVSSK